MIDLIKQTNAIMGLDIPFMLKRYHDQGRKGFAVVADDTVTRGGQVVGVWDSLEGANARAQQLRTTASSWIGGKIGKVQVFNVETLKVV